ncbi:MAG: hypothetical protein K0R18_3016 [Bacillales bacterium]|jgi:hypothetical protein|nr:hypothetical protein [Bacillales bacterium]
MSEEKKKISLQDLVQQKLNEKKQKQSGGGITSKPVQTQGMKSQLTKKPSNTRRKMGV